MRKKWMNGIGFLMLAMLLSLSSAYANGHCAKCGSHGKGGDSLEKKFYMKAHMVMENSDELGLSSQAVDEIKALKMETKKSLIRQDAEIKIAGMDLEEGLHAYPVDVEAVNKLVDTKYELKKEKAKTVVAAIAKLKSELSADQYEKLKTLWKDKKSEHHKG